MSSKDSNSAAEPSRLPNDRALRERLAREVAPLSKSPFGTAVVVSGATGQEVMTVATGTLHDGGAAADEGTRFNVASVSKALTAARVVSLAHAGAVGLDDTVAKHLPGMKLADKDGANRASSITIRQLLQHRSGLPHQPKDLEAKVSNWSAPDLLGKLTSGWEIALEGEPGQYRYSNTGYALLGAIIERTEKCTFADCMGAYLNELGMTHSTFWPATLDKNAAHGRVLAKGEAKFNPPSWYGSRYALPFTGLWASMPDLARFGVVLAAASKDAAAPLHAMASSDAGGLGVFRGTRLDAPTLEHDGSGPGFYAALVVVPSKDIVLALATNGGNESKQEVAIFSAVVSSSLGALPAP